MAAGSKEVEDTDQLTDLFLSLFGRQCSVGLTQHIHTHQFIKYNYT